MTRFVVTQIHLTQTKSMQKRACIFTRRYKNTHFCLSKKYKDLRDTFIILFFPYFVNKHYSCVTGKKSSGKDNLYRFSAPLNYINSSIKLCNYISPTIRTYLRQHPSYFPLQPFCCIC